MTAKVGASNDIHSFTVLPLRFSFSSTSCHYLFVKEHSLRVVEERKPPGKTLFVLNVPPYATETSLKSAFSKSGKVRYTILEDEEQSLKGSGFKRAFVVFDKREGLLNALKANALNPLSTDKDKIPLKIGLEKWVAEYNSSIFDPKELQDRVNNFMYNYDEAEERKKKSDKGDVADDEGWTVVTKKGRNPGIARKESVNVKLKAKDKLAAKKKQLKNFYRFQIRESKMENIAALRKSFEEAKNKINIMKKARKFKPY
ncbi:hypothetical protein NQ315_006188 [Exocentrus adspersus]|uniref:RRM domain-containing protein n=1 Tax=Exocentrus adspersus TaxID=1586481 RepID=A0AAV8VZH2_9CUCU|nr:hypothetical protein NQ315_006188 [Exocentrus adspersus]